MNPFDYSCPTTADAAISEVTHRPNSKFLAGGTNLIDLMRERIEQPDMLVDVTRLPLSQISERSDGGLSVGACVRNTVLAAHPLVGERYPVLSQAILSGASGQIRNMATVGGNVMQRTRCFYFYDEAARCNKRQPGAGCDAVEGFNRIHAILGASDSCIATHPSDMCVALAALDAEIRITGPHRERTVPLTAFHRLPGDTPHIETELQADELIVSVELPPLQVAARSSYRKVRDRASYAFALVSVAAALSTEDGVITDVRLALGGVAHKPWRAFEAERRLRHAPATLEQLQLAVDAELASSRSFPHNHFKVDLARRTAVSVLHSLIAPEDRR